MTLKGDSVRTTFIFTLCVFLFAGSAFAQGDRGTITGTVSDSTNAVIPGAGVTATNTQTTAKYETVSTETGNYTLAQLPAGVYDLTVELPGFKKYVRQGITVQVSTTLRIDVALEVGAATEEVTVNADAPLLKTESGELSHNVRTDTMDALPLVAIGVAAGSSSIRNPQTVASLLPGTYLVANNNLRVNGVPGNTASYRIEGQDATNGSVNATQQQTQPSIDAIQEVTILTSNFAAEYGQVGGGFFNYTMKSGTNQFHGSAYDYVVNEALNASAPWVNAKPPARRHDYGFTAGGPVTLGKLYDGHNKTFFFFNWEQFRETQNINNQTLTLPTDAYRNGDFRTALTGRVLGTDPLGRPIIEGTIYDPATTRAALDGRIVRDPFPNNTIPRDRMDPVALKVQSMVPATNLPGLTNNAIFPYLSQRVTDIPAFKIDHQLSSKAKLSYYWSQTRTASQYSPQLGASDGLPLPITAAIGTFIWAHTQRLNLDYNLAPTKLLHLGAGYADNYFTDDPPVLSYDAATELGLKGSTTTRLFPFFTGLSTGLGGVKNIGPSGNRHPLLYEKPTGNASMTWVKDNHTYKFGGELRLDGAASTLYTNTNGTYNFAADQTGLPYISASGGQVGGGTVGFPYASFLLGSVSSVRIAPINNIRLGKHQIGLFAQDTWKVTRRLTLDYGLRYDYQTYQKEQYGRLANFSPATPNPSAGGLLGAVIFEGNGPGRCNCDFAKNYPWAFGPRLGVAYQITPKTVLRVGVGIVYASIADSNGANQGSLTAPQAVSSPTPGDAVMTLRNGIPVAPLPFPNYDVGQFPQPGYATTAGGTPLVFYDRNAGRPPRQWQWSFGIQREISQNFAVEVSYVGNRGVWWNSPGLVDPNAITIGRLQAYGLDINNAADRTLLTSQIGSAAAAARGFKAPYAGFPATATVAQSIRPYPQFATILPAWAPLGKSWYDSLQVKATKRYSNGLSLTSNFTWQKQLSMGSPNAVRVGNAPDGAVNDVFNRSVNKYISPFDQPYILNVAANYTLPALKTNKIVSWAVRDWTFGTFLAYSSGLPIQAPYAQNNLNPLLLRAQTITGVNGAPGSNATYANRVPGQPLFLKDLNCHCFDPNKDFVLNPNAWADPAPGQFGTGAAYYSDYRYPRIPQENLAVGRTFRIGERASFNIRAEFSNIFNRSRLLILNSSQGNNLTSTNARATRTGTDATGKSITLAPDAGGHVDGRVVAGFGFINALTTPTIPTSRQGTIVGRFVF